MVIIKYGGNQLSNKQPNMKNYIFFTMDGFTFDLLNQETNNMQLLGDAMGNNLSDAFTNFKQNQSYLSKLQYKNLMAIETTGDVLRGLKL